MKTTIILTAVALGASASIALAQNPDHGGQPQPPPRHEAGGPGKYTIAQATSDRAQLNTIAFDGLAFLTGDFYCDTFLPPGKVSDFFGFQNMRDVDAAGMGHNTDFLTRIANNTLRILNDDQKAQLVALGKSQAPQIRELALKRLAADPGVLPQSRGRFPRRQPGLESRRCDEIHVGHLRDRAGNWRFNARKFIGKSLAR